MLELFKPLQILKDRTNPVLFDELGSHYSFNNEDKNKSLRPFIIFYNDKEDCYYYLKARDARQKSGQIKHPLYYEVLIEETEIENKKSLFNKDSYVDCSQIFKIDADLLEELVDTDCEEYKNTKRLDSIQEKAIWKTLMHAISKVPPDISILEVYRDRNNKIKGRSLYLSKQKLHELENEISFSWEDYDVDYKDILSEPLDSENARKRYDFAINFVKMIDSECLNYHFQDDYYWDRYYKWKYNLNLEKDKEKDKNSSRGFTR